MVTVVPSNFLNYNVFESIYLPFKEIDQTLHYCQVVYLQAFKANFHQSPYMSNDCLARE